MKRSALLVVLGSVAILSSVAVGCGAPAGRSRGAALPTPTSIATASTASTASTTTTPSGVASGSPYGVNVSAGFRPDAPGYVADLGAQWVRFNVVIDGSSATIEKEIAKAERWLSAGFDVVIVTNYREAGNVDTTYGGLEAWGRAGFPYLSEPMYRAALGAIVEPLVPYLDAGRQIMLEAENEVSDASVSNKSEFWRGTTEQYLHDEAVYYDTVKAIDTRFDVVLSSVTSQALQSVVDPSAAAHGWQVQRLSTLYSDGLYDAVDLHFYACTDEIAPQASWVEAHLQPGTSWISTENAGPTPYCPTTFSDYERDPARFEAEQASEVESRLTSCADEGGTVCMWFSLFDLVDEAPYYQHLGLRTPADPSVAKPAYDVMRAFLSR